MTDAEKTILAGGTPNEMFNDTEIDGLARAVRRLATKHGRTKINTREILALATKEAGANRKRVQVIQRLHQLPKGTVSAVLAKRLQISDKMLYSVYKADGKTFNLIPTDEAKSIGLRNFTNAKYDKHFLLQELGLLYTTSSSPTNARYNSDLPDEITNGVVTIKADGVTVIDEMPIEAIYTPISSFVGDGKHRFNRLTLSTPKWFTADTQIEAELKLANPLTTGHVKIVFGGSELMRY